MIIHINDLNEHLSVYDSRYGVGIEIDHSTTDSKGRKVTASVVVVFSVKPYAPERTDDTHGFYKIEYAVRPDPESRWSVDLSYRGDIWDQRQAEINAAKDHKEVDALINAHDAEDDALAAQIRAEVLAALPALGLEQKALAALFATLARNI